MPKSRKDPQSERNLSPMPDDYVDYFCDNPKCLLHVPYEDGKPWASVCIRNRCPNRATHYPNCDRCLVIDRGEQDADGRIYCKGCQGDPDNPLSVTVTSASDPVC